MKKVIIFGFSGLTKGFIVNNLDYLWKGDISYDIECIYLDKEYIKESSFEGIPIVSDVSQYKNYNCTVLTYHHDLRKKWIKLADSLEMEHISIIHKDNYIAQNVKIGKGCFIGQNNIIESSVTIGDYFIAGYNNRIGHDSVISDFCHTYVGANIGGFNTIGNNTSICSSSCTKEYVNIGDNSTLGLGAVLFKDLNDNCTAIGNPARIVKNDKNT